MRRKADGLVARERGHRGAHRFCPTKPGVVLHSVECPRRRFTAAALLMAMNSPRLFETAEPESVSRLLGLRDRDGACRPLSPRRSGLFDLRILRLGGIGEAESA